MVEQTQIDVLDFPECVRSVKEMYISSKEHQIFEILDNAVDEVSSGYGNIVAVAIIEDTITVEDNGRGMPIAPHKDKRFQGLSQAEVAYTVLHAGGKFKKDNSYKTATGGLHGVGASASNALSDTLNLRIKTGGKKYEINFEKGIIVNKLHVIEKGLDKSDTGTEVEFTFDETIWKNVSLNIDKIHRRIKQLAYLNPDILFYFYVDTKVNEEQIKIEKKYKFENGIKAYVEKLTSTRTILGDIITDKIKGEDFILDFSFAYTDSYTENIYTFCNNIPTEDGGQHLIGFRQGIQSAISEFGEDFFKEKISIDDILEGVIAVVSLKARYPKFDGQNKKEIDMPEIKEPIKNIIKESLYSYLDRNPNVAKIILEKIDQALKARMAAKKARELTRQKKNANSNEKPEKFADCSSKNPTECEIYIVEGDSAGGSAKQGRNRKFQAVLPVDGKIRNVDKSKITVVYNDNKLRSVVSALQCNIGEDFDIKKIRYHKIIIMTDADVDGAHIRLLYMTFFYRYMRAVIENGYLYFACPPLYMITKGKTVRYAYNDAEKEKILKELGGSDNIQRYKGLGEMDATQLWETTMNPEERTLIQITIEDAEAAEEMIQIFMSDNVAPRREYIMENKKIIS